MCTISERVKAMIENGKIQEIPLIDTHVHRVHPDRSPEFGHVGGGYIDGPNQAHHARQTILYHMVIEALRKEFQLPEEMPVEDVEQERKRRYDADPKAYYRELIKNQNVSMYCLEIGSPLGNAAYSKEEAAYFNESIPEDKRCSIVRIDRVLDDLLPEKKSFDQFLQSYHENLRNQMVEECAVGLKSCAAYYGGLDVKIVDRMDAQKAYEAIRQEQAMPYDYKLLNNYILLHSMEEAHEFDVPLQIHTGAGGGNYLDFRTENPIHLVDFLKHKHVFNRVKIVLLHGGHPHEEDTSYLTAQFSNVYTDFSGTFYLCSLKGVERMCALLERTPLNKVMYGSDGVMFPEVSWFAPDHFRKQLSKMLNGLIEDGYMTNRRADEVAKMIMYDNALQCYTKIKKNGRRISWI